MDALVDSDLAELRRELQRLRAENIRLSRLLDLRGLNTAPRRNSSPRPSPHRGRW